MLYYIFIIIIIILICYIIYDIICNKLKTYSHFIPSNGDEAIDINDIMTDKKVITTIRKILKDVDGIFRSYNLTYWIDAGTMLGAVRHHDVIPWDDDADVCIMENDEEKLLALKPILYETGYGLVKWWGGYKIFPLNGTDIKYLDYNKNQKDKDREYYDYKFPFLDVFLIKDYGSIYHLANPLAKKKWPKYYHDKKDLFPLKEYKFHDFMVYGPNNPIPYLDRAYKDWRTYAFRGYDHENEQSRRYIEFQIKDVYDKIYE